MLRFHEAVPRTVSTGQVGAPRHGDELQMLGAGLYWSLQYGPGCHLSNFSFLICKMGITQQHTPWDKLGDLNYKMSKCLY